MAARKAFAFCRLCFGLAAKVIPNEPGSAKPHSPPGSKQTQTVKDFTFFFFFLLFSEVPFPDPGP